MSDEPVSEELAEDDEAEVEGHVMFAEKKGFALKPDITIPPIYRPEGDDWERPGAS